MNHLLLHLLASEIADSVNGRKVGSIRILHPILSIELAAKSDQRYLVVLLSTPGPFCYYDSRDPVGGAGEPVLKRVHGARVSGAPEVPADRVLRLALEASGETNILAIYLYGSAGRIRILGRDRVVESLEPAESGMPLPKRTRQDAVPLAVVDPSALSAKELSVSDAPRQVFGLAPELVELFSTDSGTVDIQSILRFRDDMVAGKTPFDLATNGRIGRVTPIPKGARGTPGFAHRYGPFESAVDACAAAGRTIVQVAYEAILERFRGPLRRHLQKRTVLLQDLEDELRMAETFDHGRNEADILAAFQSQIPPGASVIELPDLYAKGQKRTLKLDPSRTIIDQIQKRYKRAAKLERSRGILGKRIKSVGDEISDLSDRLERAERESGFFPALELLQKSTRYYRLQRQSRGGGRSPAAVKQHRRFDLDERWSVLVGRNDRENDEITFRIARPDDIWMHAQQVQGSHVVLRSSGSDENPPKSIMEAAAGIAAFYSKARNSNLVPVIYTKRKYVQKFRGAKPGQVRCEREKTIFVQPKLPSQREE
jgi:predicted ribosome quality control (RQC) complex YloA/Tae2 family protein